MTQDWLTKAPPEKTVNSLVALALGSQDPVIYAMAVYACAPVFGPAPGGTCDQIRVKAWADIDWDNAAAWSAAANAARLAKDTAAENTAYSMAAKATRTDDYAQAISTIAESALPADLGPLERYRLPYDLKMMATTFQPPFGIYARRCDPSANAKPDIQTECGAIAALLLSKGTTVRDFSQATSIGAQIGWSTQRLSALKEKRDAIQTLTMARATGRGEVNPWSCDAVNRGNAFLRDWQQLGELDAYERQLEQSEKTTAEFAQDHMEFALEIQRQIDELRKSETQAEN